jgi:TM2 domain-containing membrane protein YozV
MSDYDDGLNWRTGWPEFYANCDAPTGAALNYDDPALAPTQAAPTQRIPTPTRVPYSRKRRSVAGWLQILGGITVFPGAGRWYTGHTTRAAIYTGLWILGLVTVFGFIGGPILIGCHVWSIIDGCLFLGGSKDPLYSCDGQGRALR